MSDAPPLSAQMQELCNTQQTMLGVSWSFTIVWVFMFAAWGCIVVKTCSQGRATAAGAGRDQCAHFQPMQWLMLIVPFFHFGDAIWQLWTYTHCTCMQCQFTDFGDFLAWKGFEYTFSLGRLSALLLCLFCISTGAGTIRPRLTFRNVLSLVILFGGFLTATALGLPLTVAQLGIDSTAAFIASLIMYIALLIVIQSEAYGNSKALKAQLVMIRHQGINPATTPAFHKFRLFTKLRRWVFGYFVLHTFIIISQLLPMELWQRVLLLVIWELVQLAITGAIGWLFKYSSKTNVYLDREEHLPLAQVAQIVEAHEVSLGWNDSDLIVAEDGIPVGPPTLGTAASVSTPSGAVAGTAVDVAGGGGRAGGGSGGPEAPAELRPWQEGMPVPPPPVPPPLMISIFPVQPGRRGRGRGRTGPAAGRMPEADSQQRPPVAGVPVGVATPAPPHHEV